jgi:Gas vesicle protein K
MSESLAERSNGRPAGPRIDIDPDAVERGLGQLVLTVVELVRQLLERQALRRVEAGSLSDDEIERLGLALMRLEERMERLKREFGLEDRDLELTLGPLADLLREEQTTTKEG